MKVDSHCDLSESLAAFSQNGASALREVSSQVSTTAKMTRHYEVRLCRIAAVLVGSRRGTRVLHDEDSTSIVVRSRKRLNTLAHYKVPDGASLALQTRQLYATSAKNGTVKQHNGTCHRPVDDKTTCSMFKYTCCGNYMAQIISACV